MRLQVLVLVQERQPQALEQIEGTYAEVPRRMRRHRMMSQRSSAVDHDYLQMDQKKMLLMLLLLIVSLLHCL